MSRPKTTGQFEKASVSLSLESSRTSINFIEVSFQHCSIMNTEAVNK